MLLAISYILETIILMGLGGYFFLKAWKVTKHPAYIAIGISYYIFIIGFITMISSSWFPAGQNMELVYILFKIYFFFTVIGFGIIVNSLLVIKSGSVNIITHIPTLLLGMLIGLLFEDKNIILIYWEKGHIWFYSHPMNVIILFFIVFTVYFILLLDYIVIKHKVSRRRSRISAAISLVGMLLLIFWVLSNGFVSYMWYAVHLFSLSPAAFLFALSLYVDPLTYLYSKNRITKIFILSENHETLVYYDIKNKKRVQDKIEPDLMRAAGLFVKEYGGGKADFSNPDKSVSVKFERFEFRKMPIGRLYVVAFGNKLDLNIIASLTYILKKINEFIDFKHLKHYSTVTEEEEEKIIKLIDDELTGIYA